MDAKTIAYCGVCAMAAIYLGLLAYRLWQSPKLIAASTGVHKPIDFEELRERGRKEFREDIAAGVAEGWRRQVEA